MAAREGRLVLAAALGSGLGGGARYLVGLVEPASTFPWPTLAVNASGCLLIGVAAALAAHRGLSATAGHFLLTGICGGYTTVSVFGLETLQLLQAGKLFDAAAYVILSILICLAAVILGSTVAGQLAGGRGR